MHDFPQSAILAEAFGVGGGWSPVPLIQLAALLIVILLLVSLHRRLARIEHLIARKTSAAPDTQAISDAKHPANETPETGGGPFQQFIAEAPSRKLLRKSEQAALYRQWRKEKGLNFPKR